MTKRVLGGTACALKYRCNVPTLLGPRESDVSRNDNDCLVSRHFMHAEGFIAFAISHRHNYVGLHIPISGFRVGRSYTYIGSLP